MKSLNTREHNLDMKGIKNLGNVEIQDCDSLSKVTTELCSERKTGCYANLLMAGHSEALMQIDNKPILPSNNPQQVALPHPKYRADIDGLRAVAVLSVVVFHLFPGWSRGGFVGVDIFFIISGFLISSIIYAGLKKDSFSFTTFYIRRIKRIFPALIVVLVTCFVIGWFVLLPSEYKQLGKHTAGGAGFISNIFFWQESGYFDVAAHAKPLLHLWSLGIEEQFYIMWPFLLYFGWKRKFNLLMITGCISAISFSMNVAMVHNYAVATFYLPVTRLWELLLGSALSYIALHKISFIECQTQRIDSVIGSFVNFRDIQSALGLGLIFYAIFVFNKDISFPGWWALIPTLGAALVISAGPVAWINRVVLSNRVMVWFGIISYPLYLWHWPLFSFATILGNGELTRGMRVAVVISAIILSWLTYKIIEKPIRFGEHNQIKFIAPSILMLVIGLSGIHIYYSDGAAYRFPKTLNDFLNQKVSIDEFWRHHSCFLAGDEDNNKFGLCADVDRHPLIFLWGDSHAAALYPGLRQLQAEGNFGIAQYTASACPPLIMQSKFRSNLYCKSINMGNLERIKRLKPDVVLLHADWNGVGYDLSGLPETVQEIRKRGVLNIVLLGPVPQWKDTIQRSIYEYYRAFGHMPPKRMNFHLDESIPKLDKQMYDLAQNAGIRYVSALDVLCNQDGCLTRLQEDGTELMAIDHGHLSSSGAYFLVSSIAKDLIKTNP
jgi:peptidoglycan/LPS O-acetylase OafA/YrhL